MFSHPEFHPRVLQEVHLIPTLLWKLRDPFIEVRTVATEAFVSFAKEANHQTVQNVFQSQITNLLAQNLTVSRDQPKKKQSHLFPIYHPRAQEPEEDQQNPPSDSLIIATCELLDLLFQLKDWNLQHNTDFQIRLKLLQNNPNFDVVNKSQFLLKHYFST